MASGTKFQVSENLRFGSSSCRLRKLLSEKDLRVDRSVARPGDLLLAASLRHPSIVGMHIIDQHDQLCGRFHAVRVLKTNATILVDLIVDEAQALGL